MKPHRGAVRAVARAVDSFPWLKKGLKDAYTWINFQVYGRTGNAVELHPDVALIEPCAWPKAGAVSSALSSAESAAGGASESALFFGYYDTSPWSPDVGKMVFHAGPKGGKVDIVVVERPDGRWRAAGSTTTWNWQQGSMTQWLPGSSDTVVFNDLVEGALGCVMLSLASGERRAINWPVAAVHPSGEKALSLNYRRLARLRPEYGYACDAANFADDMDSENDGLWEVDLSSGEGRLVVPLAELIADCNEPGSSGAHHKVNHPVYAPSGERFVFVHRWFTPRGKFSRLYVVDAERGKRKLLLDERIVSHYCWFDATKLLVWGRFENREDYYLIDTASCKVEPFAGGALRDLGDGHPSFSPDRRWLITDTYPDRARRQHLLLIDVRSGKRHAVGSFLAPWRFRHGERCDLHPRWSPDGTMISIDSAHTGARRTYIVDVEKLVGDAR